MNPLFLAIIYSKWIDMNRFPLLVGECVRSNISVVVCWVVVNDVGTAPTGIQ